MSSSPSSPASSSLHGLERMLTADMDELCTSSTGGHDDLVFPRLADITPPASPTVAVAVAQPTAVATNPATSAAAVFPPNIDEDELRDLLSSISADVASTAAAVQEPSPGFTGTTVQATPGFTGTTVQATPGPAALRIVAIPDSTDAIALVPHRSLGTHIVSDVIAIGDHGSLRSNAPMLAAMCARHNPGTQEDQGEGMPAIWSPRQPTHLPFQAKVNCLATVARELDALFFDNTPPCLTLAQIQASIPAAIAAVHEISAVVDLVHGGSTACVSDTLVRILASVLGIVTAYGTESPLALLQHGGVIIAGRISGIVASLIKTLPPDTDGDTRVHLVCFMDGGHLLVVTHDAVFIRNNDGISSVVRASRFTPCRAVPTVFAAPGVWGIVFDHSMAWMSAAQGLLGTVALADQPSAAWCSSQCPAAYVLIDRCIYGMAPPGSGAPGCPVPLVKLDSGETIVSQQTGPHMAVVTRKGPNTTVLRLIVARFKNACPFVVTDAVATTLETAQPQNAQLVFDKDCVRWVVNGSEALSLPLPPPVPVFDVPNNPASDSSGESSSSSSSSSESASSPSPSSSDSDSSGGDSSGVSEGSNNNNAATLRRTRSRTRDRIRASARARTTVTTTPPSLRRRRRRQKQQLQHRLARRVLFRESRNTSEDNDGDDDNTC